MLHADILISRVRIALVTTKSALLATNIAVTLKTVPAKNVLLTMPTDSTRMYG
jgi:hypothetical protein